MPLKLNLPSIQSKFKLGDTVQWLEDPRFIGRVRSIGNKIGVRWVNGSDQSLNESELRLFTDLVGGIQKIYGEYAFTPGDRVTSEFKNYKKVTFTVVQNLPSGMVEVSHGKDVHLVRLPGNQLNLIKKAATPKKEEPCLAL